MPANSFNRFFRRLSQRRSFSLSSSRKNNKSASSFSSPAPLQECMNTNCVNNCGQALPPTSTSTRLELPHTASWTCCSHNCSSSLTSGSNYQSDSHLNHPKISAHSSPMLGGLFGFGTSSNNSLNKTAGKNAHLEQELSRTVPRMPEKLLLKCLDHVLDPFALCRLKRVSRRVCNYVEERMDRVVEMDARKTKLSAETLQQLSHSSTVSVDGQEWYAHPSKDYKVLMRLVPLLHSSEENSEWRVEIMVDDHWTSRDISLLCNVLMHVFRSNLKRISLDAPIVELIIASLSIIDLDRWYAFQCFMKAVNDHQMHLAINHLPQSQSSSQDDLYWPKVEALIIRSTERGSAHLARLLDYGVRSQLVMDRRKLDILKIMLTDVKNTKLTKDLIRNLYHFRCWAGSAGFDDRFSQHYSVNVV